MDKTSKVVIFGILFFILTFTGIFMKNGIVMTLGIASLVIMFLFANEGNKDIRHKANQDMQKVLNYNDFHSDKSRLSFDLMKGLSINEHQQKVGYLDRLSLDENFSLRELQFSNILEAKIIKNKQTITTTSTGSQALRMATGGVLLGGVGAIVGGLSAKEQAVQKIRELTLEIVVDDILNPRYTFTFYKSEIPLDVSKEKSKKVIEDIENWYRSFTVIINRNTKLGSVSH